MCDSHTKKGVGHLSHYSATVLRPYFSQTRANSSGVHFAPTHIYKNKNKKIYIYMLSFGGHFFRLGLPSLVYT